MKREEKCTQKMRKRRGKKRGRSKRKREGWKRGGKGWRRRRGRDKEEEIRGEEERRGFGVGSLVFFKKLDFWPNAKVLGNF